jgi:aminocarboxymuconate-semialdehyde decarboxylase
MLYRCGPTLPHAMKIDAKRARRRAASRRHFTVDIHCHVYTPEAERVVAAGFRPEMEAMFRYANAATREINRRQSETIREKMTSIEARLADMDRLGIDVQAISPAPPQYYYWAAPELGREAAQLVNNRIAEIAAAHPDRFVGLGTVPLQAPELAVVELERLVKELGLRGVEICTNVAGAELSEERFRPFFAKAEELGILIFMHPNGFTDGQRLADHYFINVIGNPLDSTVAVSHLIFGGVLDAYPRLKICIAHGGGFLPAYSGRMDHAHGARSDCRRMIAKKPTRHLAKLYFDSIVFTHHQLEYLVERWGSDHILLGSDYPFDMAEPDPVGFVSGAKLSGDDKAAILGRNAAKLLKIRVPAAPPRKR